MRNDGLHSRAWLWWVLALLALDPFEVLLQLLHLPLQLLHFIGGLGPQRRRTAESHHGQSDGDQDSEPGTPAFVASSTPVTA